MSGHAKSNSLLSDFTIAFSGHRRIGSETMVQKALESVLDRIQSSNTPDTRYKAVASTAAGSDVLFCEAILSRNWPLCLILPFSEPEFLKDFTGIHQSWLTRAQSIIKQSKELGRLRTLEKRDSRNQAYLECGKACLDQANLLIAVVRSGPANSSVGAHAMVEYAQYLKIPYITIDPEKGTVDFAASPFSSASEGRQR